MSVSTAVRMALAKGNKRQIELAEYLGIQRQPVNLKLAKERWTGAELVKIAAFTGAKLAFVYPDGQEILIDNTPDPKQKPEASQEKEKAKPAAKSGKEKTPAKPKEKKVPAKPKKNETPEKLEEQISFFG